jgi:hypothetical protein
MACSPVSFCSALQSPMELHALRGRFALVPRCAAQYCGSGGEVRRNGTHLDDFIPNTHYPSTTHTRGQGFFSPTTLLSLALNVAPLYLAE